jgi:hypothetical protein
MFDDRDEVLWQIVKEMLISIVKMYQQVSLDSSQYHNILLPHIYNRET